MHTKKFITILTLAVSLTLLGGCDESEPSESAPIEASGTETVGSDTVPGSEVTLSTDVITAETPTSGESADPDVTQGGDDAQDAGESEHTHTWVDETRYNTVHHDAEYKTVHHDAQTHTVHHDAVTHTETQTTYITETQVIHHDATDGEYWCNACGAHFSSEAEAQAHQNSGGNGVNCIMDGYSGHGGSAAWDETVTVQVPHTETVTIIDQAAWDETIVDKPAWDETVVDQEAYDEQVPYTVTVCSECGEEK